MQSRKKYKYECEDDNGQSVNTLRKVIDNNDTNQLNELLQQDVDIKLKLDKKNPLQYAARLGRWQCADLLIQHSKTYKRYYGSANYMRSAGEVLLLAAQENQTAVVKGIFELINLQRKVNDDIVDDGLLYCMSAKPRLRRNGEQDYTSLHWAVYHNNPDLCELFAFFTKIPGAYFKHYMADAPIFRAKDKNGQTAFDLAVSLGYMECAKKIAIGMSYEYLVYHAQDHVLCDTFLADVRLFFTYSGGLEPEKSPTKKDYDKIKKMMLQHILGLSVDEQQKSMDAMTHQGTALYALFNLGSSSMSEKYINQLAANIHQESNIIHHGTETATVSSSTSRLLKRFNSRKDDPIALHNLEDKPRTPVIVKIANKKEYMKSWMVYEEIPTSSSTSTSTSTEPSQDDQYTSTSSYSKR